MCARGDEPRGYEDGGWAFSPRLPPSRDNTTPAALTSATTITMTRIGAAFTLLS